MNSSIIERLSTAAEFGRPLILAHRGYSNRELENTLPAFAAAVNAGSDGIELDVQLSRDDQVVVFHDRDLRRLVGGDTREIRECTARELQEIPPHFGVPSLKDVLSFLPREMIVDVELKSYNTTSRNRLVARVVETLIETAATDRVLVSSFDPWLIRLFHRILPKVPTAVIFCDDPGVPRILRRGLGVDLAGAPIAKPSVEHVLRGRRPRRKLFLAWTVHATSEIDALVAAGAAGIITNDPVFVQTHMQNSIVSPTLCT